MASMLITYFITSLMCLNSNEGVKYENDIDVFQETIQEG